jgi:regulator of RNase E activity RraA
MISNTELQEAFSVVTAANLADACVRLGSAFSVAPPLLKPLFPGARCAGRALPVTHFGSVDVFFEAMDGAEAGDVLVIDNANRTDEACIGDLTVIEAATAGIAGVVLWGLHRDTAELLEIGLPVFSTGSMPLGPRSVRERTTPALGPCSFGGVTVEREHIVFADGDGILFVPARDARVALETARAIAATERRQADDVRRGTSLRQQMEWETYLDTRRQQPRYTLREHLAKLRAAIEV